MSVAMDKITRRSQTAATKISACPFKGGSPEPFTVRDEPDEDILQRRREHHPLQPFCPREPPRKRGVTPAGQHLAGLRPRHFPPAPRGERFDGHPGGFERHGHPVARHGRNHRDGVADATFGARGGTLRAQRNSGHCTKRAFVEFGRRQPLVQRRTGLTAQPFAPVLRRVVRTRATPKQSTDIHRAALYPAQADVAPR